MSDTTALGPGGSTGRRSAKAAGFGGLVLVGLWVAMIGLTAPWSGAPEGVTLVLFAGGVVASVLAGVGGGRSLQGARSSVWLASWMAVLAVTVGLAALFYAV